MSLSDVFSSIQSKLLFTKDVEVGGIKFKIGLLTYEEEVKTNSLPDNDSNPLAYFSEMRMLTLSYAIKEINSEVVPAVVETKKDETVEKKEGPIAVREFLITLPDKIVEQLFDVYVDLKDQSDSTLTAQLKYDWFKTPEQREKEKAAPKEEAPKEATEEKKEDIKFRKIEEPEEDKAAG